MLVLKRELMNIQHIADHVFPKGIRSRYTGYLSICRTYVTANNSINYNVLLFFVSNLKIVYYNNYQSSIIMPWTREEKYFASLIIWRQNHSKLRKQTFVESLNLTIIPWKPNLSSGRQISRHRTSKKPHQEVRKSQIWQGVDCRCPDNVDAVRDSVGKSPKKFFRRRSQELGLSCASLQRILKKYLQLYTYRIQINHKLLPADMEKRLVIYQWFENKIEEVPDFLEDV